MWLQYNYPPIGSSNHINTAPSASAPAAVPRVATMDDDSPTIVRIYDGNDTTTYHQYGVIQNAPSYGSNYNYHVNHFNSNQNVHDNLALQYGNHHGLEHSQYTNDDTIAKESTGMSKTTKWIIGIIICCIIAIAIIIPVVLVTGSSSSSKSLPSNVPPILKQPINGTYLDNSTSTTTATTTITTTSTITTSYHTGNTPAPTGTTQAPVPTTTQAQAPAPSPTPSPAPTTTAIPYTPAPTQTIPPPPSITPAPTVQGDPNSMYFVHFYLYMCWSLLPTDCTALYCRFDAFIWFCIVNHTHTNICK
jgi:hypothetical protein